MIAVFLAAYGIPVTFGSIMSVLGSNQLANLVSFTPGGIGVNQAFNSFALESYTSTQTATAYSTGQQLDHDGLQHGLRDHPRLPRLRMEERVAARPLLLRRREGEGHGDEGGAEGEPCAGTARRMSRPTTRISTRTPHSRRGSSLDARPVVREGGAPVCCLALIAGFLGPRLALFVWWVFGDKVEAAFSSWILPLLGLIFLPWTTIAYVSRGARFTM